MKIILATRNLDKLAEIQPFFPQDIIYTFHDFDLPSPPETGKTYIENAILKARFATLKTKLPAIADDSGLEVDYLDKKPGLFSARFMGDHKIEKLLELLKGVPMAKRTACFRSVLVWLQNPDDPSPKIGQGTLCGLIAEKPVGTNGFGYDPIFYLTEYNKTVAELPGILKHQVSHRAKALRNLLSSDY